MQGHTGFRGVLHTDGPTSTNGVLVGQADFQAVADFGARAGVGIVVLPVDLAHEVQLLVQDSQRLARNSGRRQKAISHVFVPLWLRPRGYATKLRSPLSQLAVTRL